MKHVNIGMGICVLVVMAFLLSAGCIFQPSGNASAQQPGTQTAAAAVSAPNTNPSQAVAANATPDPWAKFVAPTEVPGANATEPVVSEAPTTETPAAPVVIITEVTTPTPVPTTPVVNDTCSNIGGNSCLANETCSGAYIRTTDDPKCCAGVCQSG